MNYLVTVSYDGTNFHGWAKQNNVRTVQEDIENIINKIFDQKITIACAGRTDAYVHAIGQVFSFNVKKSKWTPKSLLIALRKLSPNDIYFINIKKVDGMFNARFNAKNKTYRYVINQKYDLFKQNYELYYPQKINLTKIKNVAKLFVGQHDFKSFSTSELENTTRKINSIKFKKSKSYLYIEINGDGFLRNMVRMIVGNLLDVNENKKKLNDIKELLHNPKKGSSVTKIQGKGLYLLKIFY